jgi:hypothetical protein
VSSETPAAHLARLKVSYPQWRIWRGEQTNEYWAAPPPGHDRQALVDAPDLPALEAKISEIERHHE